MFISLPNHYLPNNLFISEEGKDERTPLKTFLPHIRSISRNFQDFIESPVLSLGDLGTYCVRILFLQLSIFDNHGSEFFSFVWLVDVNVYLATGPHFCSFLLTVIIENHVISFCSHTFDQKSIEGFNQGRLMS